MNTKPILGLSFAAFFAVTMMMSPAFAGMPVPDYLQFDGSADIDVKSNPNPNNANDRVKVTVEMDGDIPTDGSEIFGYAALSGGGLNNVLVLVTHLPIDDSDHEDPVSGFHTHVLDLIASPMGNCDGYSHEVDLTNSVANKGFDLDANWEVDGNTASFGYTPTKLLNDSTTIDAVVSFTVDAVFDGPNLTNLCVDVIEAAP